jgi:hypothetical protein
MAYALSIYRIDYKWLASICGTTLVPLVVFASALAIIKPLPVAHPSGTEVSPSDTTGVNLLEPPDKVTSSDPIGSLTNNKSVERIVSEWTPTGGGAGGGGSPKK